MDRIWRFADLEYSTECGLQSSGASVALQPKVRGLLELLLRAQGATVSKGAIAAALWPTEAISDESLARIVHMLRKALKNAGVDVVRTVHGNGVQLTCPIEEADAEPLPGHAAGVDMLRTVREVAAGRTSAAVAEAKETLRFAIGLDPDFASAWVLMADCIAVQAMRGAVAPEAAVLEIGEACGKALKLDPRDAGALAVSGWSLGALSGRLAEGQKRLDQAVAMAPDSYLIRYYRAWVRCLDRDLTDALADIEVAFAAHPLERALLTMHVWLRLCRGETAVADLLANKAVKVRPDADTLLVMRSIALGADGQAQRALAYAERAAEIARKDRFTLSQLCYAYAEAGQAGKARKTLELVIPGPDGYAPAYLAAPLVALGELTGARRMIERSKARCCPWRAFAWCDPRLRPLRADG